VTLLVFLFVVVPMSGNWGVMSAPLFGWGTLFVVFGIVAIVTWALFRRFPSKPATTSSPQDAAAPPRSRR
jgi:membrane protein implicated in regulation of membrane protease activity